MVTEFATVIHAAPATNMAGAVSHAEGENATPAVMTARITEPPPASWSRFQRRRSRVRFVAASTAPTPSDASSSV